MDNSTIIFSFTFGMLKVLISLLVFAWAGFVAYILNYNAFTKHAGLKSWNIAGWVCLVSPVIFGVVAYDTMAVFRAYLIFDIIIVVLIFFAYAWEYCIALWYPIWKFYAKMHNVSDAQIEELHLSLSYCFHKFFLFWSWGGYSFEKSKQLQGVYNGKVK